MTPDFELLRHYAEERSQDAFAELVRRHLNFVYSVALRQLGGDAHRAKDVAQSVFTDLAKKARSISPKVRLAGWLYRSAHFAAAKIVRTECRRQRRELEAQAMHELSSASSPGYEWERLRPLIDETMQALDDDDREAVVLRIFEGRPFEEVGAMLDVSDTAARKRVARALDRLQSLLRKRGITSTGAALGLVLSSQAVVAAPAGLAASVTGVALSIAASSTAAVGLFQIMSANKLLVGISGLILAGSVGTNFYQARLTHETEATLAAARQENIVLQDRIRELEQNLHESAARQQIAASNSAGEEAGAAVTQPNKQKKESARRAEKKAAAAAAPLQPVEAVDPVAAAYVQQKNKVLKQYGGILNDLQLTQAERDQFIQLLIDKRQTSMDLAVANAKQGDDVSLDRELFDAEVSSTRDVIDDQIKALLGDDRYKQFVDGVNKQRQDALFVRLQNRLRPFKAELNAEQIVKLQTVLQGMTSLKVNDQVVAEAGTFLSPQQLGALQEINQQRKAGPNKPKMQKAISQNLTPAP